jgi:molybdate transport system regulatory protein
MTTSASSSPCAGASGPEARFRLRVMHDGEILVGPGRIDLLEAVRKHGSISAAARSLDMSYRRAWLLIDHTNRAMVRPAVTSEPGGRKGGGTVLTPDGEALVRLYREIEARAREAAAPELSAMLALMATR